MSAYGQDKTFDPADVIADDSDGTAAISEKLAASETRLANKYPGDTSGLKRPYVDGAVEGLASADFGISEELLEAPPEGVHVIVPAWPGIKARDTLLLFWDDILVATRRITRAQQNAIGEKSNITLRVEAEDVPKGLKTLRYEVESKGKRTQHSPRVTTLMRFGQPGVEGTTGVGQELAAPTVALPASGVIGASDANGKIKVTIAPYLSMNPGDRIHLFWGDEHSVEHVVSKTEVGKPVVIEVDGSLIKQAGDSDALPVYYYVLDEVGNESEWSADAWVKVNTATLELQAPVVLDRNGAVIGTGEIDPFDLASDHAVVQVNGEFRVGDVVELIWHGSASSGLLTPATYGPVNVTQAGTTLTFPVPVEVLVALSGGSTRLTYTLTRNGVSTPSKASFFNIKGEPAPLPPPSLNKAEEDWVDADHPFVHALIPQEAGLLEEDEVTVKWTGTTSDNAVQALSSKMFRVTRNRVGKRLPIQLKGASFLKPFDGGWVDVWYEVKRGKQVYRSSVVRYYVGEPAETLPAPFTSPALPNGILDPSLPRYEFDMQLEVPAEAVQPTPSTVTVIWETSEGGYYEDEQVLEKGDEVSPFLIPADELKIKGDKPVKVWAYYQVEWDGKPSKVSADFEFRIASAAMLRKLIPAVSIPGGQDGKLDLGKVTADGLKFEIPHYEGMAVGDRIRIKFGDTVVKEHVVTAVGKQTVNFSVGELAGLSGEKSVVMTYEVERYPSGDKTVSQPVTFELEGTLTRHPTTEDFESVRARQLVLGQFVDFPAVRVRLDKGNGSIYYSTVASWKPTWKNIVYAGYGAHLSFVLRGRAKSITFDIAEMNRTPSTVEFYGSDDKLIGTIKTPPFSSSPPTGYTIYSTQVSYTSPGPAIAWFKFIDGGRDTYIDNLSYVVA